MSTLGADFPTSHEPAPMAEPTVETLVEDLVEARRAGDRDSVLHIADQITGLRDAKATAEREAMLSVIPDDYENAALMRVTVNGESFVGTFYRNGRHVDGIHPRTTYTLCDVNEVDTATRVTVIDDKALSGPDRRYLLVPVELGERATRQMESWNRDLSYPVNDTHRDVFKTLADIYRENA